MKKAIIIGGAGFVGNYLADELIKNGYETFVTKLSFEKFDSREDKLKVYDLDITDYIQTEKVLLECNPDIIFHLAAQSSVKLSWEKPELTLNVNVMGALNVLNACRKIKDAKGETPKILLIGSAEEYGKVPSEKCPIDEELSCIPDNIYALSKMTQNHLGRIYGKVYGLDIINVRAFNHFGPGQSPQFVIADFCNQVVRIEKGLNPPVINVGNLSAKRDFTDVRDIVRAYITLAEKGVNGQTYNVGSGNAIEISKMLEIILNNAQCKIDVKIDPNRMRPSDVPIHMANTTKINKLGWSPKLSVEDTIKDTLNYFRKIVEA